MVLVDSFAAHLATLYTPVRSACQDNSARIFSVDIERQRPIMYRDTSEPAAETLDSIRDAIRPATGCRLARAWNILQGLHDRVRWR